MKSAKTESAASTWSGASVDASMVRLVDDLPGNSSRLVCDAHGVDLVMVNGVPIARDGEPTRDLPGTVLRSGVDTTAVAVPGA